MTVTPLKMQSLMTKIVEEATMGNKQVGLQSRIWMPFAKCFFAHRRAISCPVSKQMLINKLTPVWRKQLKL